MKLNFYKYQGTGNDFILIDNRANDIFLSQAQVAHICHRQFGVGGDGLMLLEKSEHHDFKMVYYNSNGLESSMCGNGGRCISLFAQDLGMVKEDAVFEATDGLHYATIDDGMVELKMKDVHHIAEDKDAFVLNTGSPHYVIYCNDVKSLDINKEGAAIRNNVTYRKEGINVNFVQVLADKTLFVATFERGVENETLSCGTGVTAAALVHIREKIGGNYVRVQTKGGTLLVKCVNQTRQDFKDIFLCGPAKRVFTGEIEV